MKIDAAAVLKCLKSFDFNTIFREHLGWDKHQAQLDVPINGTTLCLTAVAQKRGFAAYVCASIPDRPTRLKIDHQVTKTSREHFVIYADQSAGQQVWQWVRHEPGKPMASRDHRFDASTTGTALIQRLELIAVTLDEEEGLTIVDVAGGARAAFDVDKVTKKFDERFKAEHAAFLKSIKGFPPPVKKDGKEEPHSDHQWYTSLMLNRLMFVYFIQKKGFLDGDTDYLRNRMHQVRQAKGKDKFQSFYRYFLLRLFHDGLGKHKDERDAELETLLGNVPYLNGGFFEEHPLEKRNTEIAIPDKAFERLFDFFDEFSWHLDERPLRAGNEINPDVVGYIFEKYINQKQMGAYYTKEDITEYISKNTIIPFLFDAARKNCPIAFKPESFLWRLLRDDPDRYIYAAVRQGVVDEQGNVIPLPKEIEAGLQDVAKRECWNRPAPKPFALPTETWREHVARRQRCLELREKLRSGEVHEINDLITLNLDIWQFARDAIVNSEGPELLRAFWQAIEKITVLDPTCGSGAFLFAALRILETLYSDCLERMARFVEELEGKPHHSQKFRDFKEVLDRIADHKRSERYFILKSIIINNLFGVDIMEEAVEICKLRLFLKLVAQVDRVDQIEPLPDIDFNIRAGNTLVGYVTLDEVRKARTSERRGNAKQKLMLDPEGEAEIRRIEEDALTVARSHEVFRAQQTRHGGKVTTEAKQELRDRTQKLDDELDHYLAGEYGISRDSFGSQDAYQKAFVKWKACHEPFHWFVEFYRIMATYGGFDVAIGNPPYVNASKVRKQYQVKRLRTEACPDVYAWCIERTAMVLQSYGRTGMIVPLSLGFSGDFATLRETLFSSYEENWFSSFGRIPSALFNYDVRVRNTIHLGARCSEGDHAHTTLLHRWFDDARPQLFEVLVYAEFSPNVWGLRIPKFNSTSLSLAFEACMKSSAIRVRDLLSRQSDTGEALYFKKTAYNWLAFSSTPPPCRDAAGNDIEQTQLDAFFPADSPTTDMLFLLLNGKWAFVFWCVLGDDFHVTKGLLGDFPLIKDLVVKLPRDEIKAYCNSLKRAMKRAVQFKLNAGLNVGTYNLAVCREITDRSDAMFAASLFLEKVWDDVELYCTQVVRTDFTSEASEE